MAVLLVIFCHTYIATPLPAWYRALGQMGWSGVDLFFVLSGFLVSGLLFQEWKTTGTARVSRFLLRRAGKIYPAFYLFLLVEASLVIYGGGTYSLSQILTEAFFFQNYGSGMGTLHTWSLAVEEHFYLLLAGCFALVIRYKIKLKVSPGVLFLLVAGSCLSLRFWNVIHSPIKLSTHLFPTHLRLDALSCGVFLAYLSHFRPLTFKAIAKQKWLCLGAGLILISPAFILDKTSKLMLSAGLTGLYLGYAAILIFTLASNELFAVRLKWISHPVAYVGRHSYSIYLWHLFFLRRFIPIMDRRLGLGLDEATILWVYVFGSLVFGILMAHLIEIPFLKLRDKLTGPSTAVTKFPSYPTITGDLTKSA